jgi:hypothetical protein
MIAVFTLLAVATTWEWPSVGASLAEIGARGGGFQIASGIAASQPSYEAPLAPAVDNLAPIGHFAERADPFERGSLARLDTGKWLIPYPSEEEMSSFLLGHQAGTVVSLLDPADPQQAAWNAQLEASLKQHDIPFIMRPLPNTNSARAAEIAAEVRELPAPVTVIVPQTPLGDGKGRQQTRAALAFLHAYGRVAPRSLAAKPSWRLNQTAE